MIEMFVLQHSSIWPNFFFRVLRIQKKLAEVEIPLLLMPIMISQILKSVDFTEVQKSRYLENKILLFLQVKKMGITKPCTQSILRMIILIPTLVVWIYNPKSIFGQIWAKKVNVVCFAWKWTQRVWWGCWFLFWR